MLPLPSIEEVKAVKQSEITTAADRVLVAAGAEYGDMERQTWDQQYAEARTYQADPDTDVPLLTAIATGRGMDVATLADRIIANRAAWVALSGRIVGQRLAYQDALDAADTAEDVAEIVVEYVAGG
ncbi:hypothetical protein GO013_11645 [Pseudodesulfovibrio sp. JC047]|uniref:hypothetical protein n=1 Tax=Pseudodesulfovibrio sp. JC047 TaxID=2683199 RepID=UPI0013D271FF|nr:hypothetical protein [Pseudodesulfovibrio sp. JC047]NDV20068.1 hypothetical protein [Pseudodesulfovibrio sp. JC047]